MPPARVALWVATLGAIALAVRSVWLGPPPLFVAALALGGYVALFLAGVFVLRLRMFANAIVNGGIDAPGLALTFDDGPHPEHTPRVLDVLRERRVRATFFVIGAKAERHPELLRRMRDEGHQIGVHSHTHDRLLSLRGAGRVRAELERCAQAIERATGERPSLFRPPVGHTGPRVARVADELGFVTVGWSVRGLDGLARTSPADVVRRVARGLRHGAIVLLHDAAERDDFVPAGIAALPLVLDEAAARSVPVVPLSELIGDSPQRGALDPRADLPL